MTRGSMSRVLMAMTALLASGIIGSVQVSAQEAAPPPPRKPRGASNFESHFVAASIYGYSGLVIFPANRILPKGEARFSYRSAKWDTESDILFYGDAFDMKEDSYILSYTISGNLEASIARNNLHGRYQLPGVLTATLDSHDLSYIFTKIIPFSKRLPYRATFTLITRENQKTQTTADWEKDWILSLSREFRKCVGYAGYFRFTEKMRSETMNELIKVSQSYWGLGVEYFPNQRLRLSAEALFPRGGEAETITAFGAHFKLADFAVIDAGYKTGKGDMSKVLVLGLSAYLGPSRKKASENKTEQPK